MAQAVAVVPGVGRQIIPSDGGDLLHPRYLPLPGRGVAAEDVKHPGTDTDLGRAMTALALLAATDTFYILQDGASHKNKSSKPLKKYIPEK